MVQTAPRLQALAYGKKGCIDLSPLYPRDDSI
jgi:hypothetical protein